MLTEQITSIPTSNLRAFNGGYLRMLVSPEQTGGSFALLDITLPKGSEPPRHIHTREDETFYVLEGIIRFDVGGNVTTCEAGQAAFAPRTVEHQFMLQTEQARMLTLVTPGEFGNYFIEFSQPIDEVPATLQAPQGPPPSDVLVKLLTRLSGAYGIQFVQ